jgi:hypothetical protein
VILKTLKPSGCMQQVDQLEAGRSGPPELAHHVKVATRHISGEARAENGLTHHVCRLARHIGWSARDMGASARHVRASAADIG